MAFQSQASQDGDRNHNIDSDSDDQEMHYNSQPRKSYERHTKQQKMKLEHYFSIDQHPDENRRQEIGDDLGIDPIRVKFWFQNRRTQYKSKGMKNENKNLHGEVQRLKAQLEVYKSGLSKTLCSKCGGPTVGDMTLDHEQHLRTENDRLKEEVARLTAMCFENSMSNFEVGPYSNFGNNSTAASINTIPIFQSHPPPQPLEMAPNNARFAVGESSKSAAAAAAAASGNPMMLLTIAEAAIQELQLMAESGLPLWLPSGLDDSTNLDILNEAEYQNNVRGVPSGLKKEATRGVALVQMTAFDIIETMANVDMWTAKFSEIVPRAKATDVYSLGTNYDGALQVILAEYQLPSPLVPMRESLFLRYCKRRAVDRTWIVVDVSVDASDNINSSIRRCQRKPSGCLIYEMENNFSKVVWVEHVEVDESFTDGMYKSIVDSGMAFGANRWLAALGRQCDLFAVVKGYTSSYSRDQAETNRIRLESMLKVAENMRISFYGSMASSVAGGWELAGGFGANDLRVTIKRNADDPKMPLGIIVNVSTSVKVPIMPKRIFDFICDDNSRNKWATLFGCGVITEASFIPMSKDGNIRNLRLLVCDLINSDNLNPNKKQMFLQESCFDQISSYVIFSPVDNAKVTNLLTIGGDPQEVQLLPSGFTIVPDAPHWFTTHGSLVTVSLQTVVDPKPESELTVAHVEILKTVVLNVVSRIKNEMLGFD